MITRWSRMERISVLTSWAGTIAVWWFVIGQLSPHSVRHCVPFDMETDFGVGRHWRRFEQWPEFLADLTQRRVVDEQSFVNLSEAPENGGVGGKLPWVKGDGTGQPQPR
jgi:hypothetical protein